MFALHLIINVMGWSGDIFAKLSMTLIWNEVISLAILWLGVQRVCHSNSCTSEEACGFVQNELMGAMLTSICSRHGWILMVALILLLQHFSVNLTLWKLLTQFRIVVRSMRIWVSYRVPCGTCIANAGAWWPHLYIFFIELRKVLF